MAHVDNGGRRPQREKLQLLGGSSAAQLGDLQ